MPNSNLQLKNENWAISFLFFSFNIKDMHIRKKIVIGMIILCKIYCKLETSSYVSLHNKNIDGKGLKIRLGGSLSPIGPSFSEKLNLMRAKRYFSSEMDIQYNLNIYATNNVWELIDFNRKFNSDTAHSKEILAKHCKNPIYIRDYHQTIAHLFPSLLSNLSIYTCGKNSFMRFIQSEHVDEHRLNILASLFLLAEGVDIPLTVEGTGSKQMLVLKEIITGEEKFSLSMLAMCNVKYADNTMKDVKLIQRKAVSVIKFFIDNKTNLDIREGGEYAEPKTYEEFKTGKFLCNSRWLIQYYIFEYLESEDSTVELAKIVYSMLMESIEKKKSEESEESNDEVKYLESIVNKCFVRSNGDVSKNWRMRTLDLLYGKDFLCDTFSFMGIHDFPLYKCVPSYNRKENSFNNSILYSNHAEVELLFLFFYLAYDPVKKEYTTEHMGNVSPDLKRFFTKYKKPSDTITYAMHNDWSKVVADLDNKNIIYVNANRNKLATCIINTLYVVSEITGRYSIEKKTLNEFRTLLKKSGCLSNLIETVKEYAKNLFTSLTKESSLSIQTLLLLTNNESSSDTNKCKSALKKMIKKEIRVTISNIYKEELDLDGKLLLNGKLTIIHEYPEHCRLKIELCHLNSYIPIKNTLCKHIHLNSSKSAAAIDIIDSINRETNNSLSDYIIKHILEQALPNNSTKKKNKDSCTENMSLANDNNISYPIDKFFLYNSMELEHNLLKTIHHIRSCLLGHPLEKTDPWARTISNMIGDLSLYKFNTIVKMVFTSMYLGGLYKNCTKEINIPDKTISSDHYLVNELYKYIVYLKKSGSTTGSVELIKAYLAAGDRMGQIFSFFLERGVSPDYTKFLSVLTLEGTTIEYLDEIAKFIDSLDKNNPKYKNLEPSNDVWIIWLKMSFKSNIFVPVIQEIFDKITIDDALLSRNKDKLKHPEKTNDELLSLFVQSNTLYKKMIETVKSLIEKYPKYSEIFYYTMKRY
ncbi:hypothetical protein NEPAR04_2209 [Nematocida parisii]|nr:hypothetical protein NEPAR08_1497 [Nematocida parisii]KAI5129551.1 hypothetical protein NEPAR03_1714 [Nematocida parisii]KAI5144713.1 hypothetical protein NEPAR04_2209 [Nematocida parisii]